VLYNGMDATTPFAAIYFITLMTIGNYVLFNLLVAILVEGFQAEVSKPLGFVTDHCELVWPHAGERDQSTRRPVIVI